MRLWRVVVLVNLALGVGLLVGYLAWGRPLADVRAEAEALRAQAVPAGVERVFRGRGVVRAVVSEINVIVLSHEDIPGFMPPMTMGFRAQDPKIYDGVAVGDVVAFTLRGVPPNVTVTELRKEGTL
ncbi:MAG TPA: copper-binding protein [Methylomirabilota bacterium]|nr:copper-binding protein [Methylomirabilota bacterium]